MTCPWCGEARVQALADLDAIKRRQEAGDRDLEGHHEAADEVLLKLIDSETIRQAYEAIRKWYS